MSIWKTRFTGTYRTYEGDPMEVVIVEFGEHRSFVYMFTRTTYADGCIAVRATDMTMDQKVLHLWANTDFCR